MPFLGQDWRDPGDRWIKDPDGSWEKAKICRLRIFEMLSDNLMKRLYRQSISQDYDHKYPRLSDSYLIEQKTAMFQSHVFIKTASTRENTVTTSLTEALVQLDMKMAIRDMRRFNYVTKIVSLLVSKHLHQLTGRTQLYLINLMKEILSQVRATRNNTSVMRKLLKDLRESLDENQHGHIGSSLLWQNHHEALDEMSEHLESPLSDPPLSSSPCTLEVLPPECLIRILSHLTSPHDLEMASQASPTLQSLVNDELLWKQLVLYNFNQDQLITILPRDVSSLDDCNWRLIYSRLLKRFGEQHFYPAKLHLCCNCDCLFWPIFGHPCHSPDQPQKSRPLSPEEFISLFHL